VAFKVLAFGLKVPPAGVDHVPPVADPPTVPAKEAVPPWQIVCPVPAFAVGVGMTLMFTVEVIAVHGFIPVVVSVKTAVPVKAAGGAHVAFKAFALGVKVPPAGVDHVPPVAAPPTIPANVADPA